MASMLGFEAALSAAYYRSPIYRRMVLAGPVPADVARPYPSHLPGDRAQAEAILREEFLFFGRVVPFGRMPWSVLPPGARLARAMHGFRWLGDLKATAAGEGRERARALVRGWIATHRAWSPAAWSPPVVGERLTSWLAAADFLLDGVGGDDRARFLDSAGRQARHLARVAEQTADSADAFPVVAGEIAAALCLRATPLVPALRRLDRAVERHILADGGHVSRNPAVLFDVLRHVVDIRAALAEAGEETPPSVSGAIERMTPMLRAMRHGDGGLALFHGAKEADRASIDSILAAGRIGTVAAASAPHTGFERLAAGRTLVIVDVGPPPPGGHSSPLAFEMSVGRERLIVNCGGFGGDGDRWRAALRSTPAHSTLIVDNADVTARGRLRSERVSVQAFRQETEGAIWLDGQHDGYRRRFGVVHRRRLYLAVSGDDLRGEDLLQGRRGRRYRVRFHLHPDVRATAAPNGGSVELRTVSGAVWRFLCVGGMTALEESTYLGVGDQPRRSQQIVVTGVTQRDDAPIKWALRRQEG